MYLPLDPLPKVYICCKKKERLWYNKSVYCQRIEKTISKHISGIILVAKLDLLCKGFFTWQPLRAITLDKPCSPSDVVSGPFPIHRTDGSTRHIDLKQFVFIHRDCCGHVSTLKYGEVHTKLGF
jgi:hypothetical protein